jgi:DnaK suppressor protein
MDEQKARELLLEERERIERLLEHGSAMQQQDEIDEQTKGDQADEAQRVTATAFDEAFLTGLRGRLAAIDRAEQRLRDGNYGRSVLSGEPLPDERLEADPAAELTVEEAEREERERGASEAA